ncbi:hypothetical protein PFISCL1PPCAC_27782, partial [Pristionchus fissidentatus]
TTNYEKIPAFDYWKNFGDTPIDCSESGTSGRKNEEWRILPLLQVVRKKRSIPVDNTMGTPGKGSCEEWNKNFKSVDDCKTWYKENGMVVNVFFESLEYKVLSESASYSIPSALNDLGGQAGLWLGFSLVSIVECLGLIVLLLMLCFTGIRINVAPHKEVKLEFSFH